MKSVLFTAHHPKYYSFGGKWLFVKLVCHVLSPYLPFLSKIKTDFEFSNENKSEAFLIPLFCLVCVSLPWKDSFLAKVQWQRKKCHALSSLFFFNSPSLIHKTKTWSFSVSYVFCCLLFIFTYCHPGKTHLYKFVFAETTHIGFCVCLSLPSKGRWDR